MQKNIGIFYFSGTGNTEIIANLLGNELAKNGAGIDFIRIEDVFKDQYYYDINGFDLVGIGYPVHAFDAPKIVYDFIKTMPRAQSKYTFIFKVAGDEFLKGGSTTAIKARLRDRGYDVFHESLYLLSSNIFVRYPDELVKQLYYTAVKRVKRMSEEILTSKMRRQENSLFMRAASYILSGLEGMGAPIFGRHLRVSQNCTQCNKCVKNCPSRNIRMEGLNVKFGWRCVLCMRCMYRCPQRAISPGLIKSAAFKEPYNIQEIIDNPNLTGEYVTKNTSDKYKRFYNYIYNND